MLRIIHVSDPRQMLIEGCRSESADPHGWKTAYHRPLLTPSRGVGSPSDVQ